MPVMGARGCRSGGGSMIAGILGTLALIVIVLVLIGVIIGAGLTRRRR